MKTGGFMGLAPAPAAPGVNSGVAGLLGPLGGVRGGPSGKERPRGEGGPWAFGGRPE